MEFIFLWCFLISGVPRSYPFNHTTTILKWVKWANSSASVSDTFRTGGTCSWCFKCQHLISLEHCWRFHYFTSTWAIFTLSSLSELYCYVRGTQASSLSTILGFVNIRENVLRKVGYCPVHITVVELLYPRYDMVLFGNLRYLLE